MYASISYPDKWQSTVSMQDWALNLDKIDIPVTLSMKVNESNVRLPEPDDKLV